MSDWAGPLDALRWHWGDAYLISFFEPDRWTAQRRDDNATVTADTPDGLRDAILADYTARPVPRRLGPGTPPPSCQFPEG